MNFWFVVPAAGVGTRFGDDRPKQYVPINGRPVITHTLERLLAIRGAGVLVALHPDDDWWPSLAIAGDPRIETMAGGEHRAESVANALAALADRAGGDDWVLVHDVARPCVDPADISRLMEALANDPVGGILGVPLADTAKRVAPSGIIEGTEDRTRLWAAQTPQMFRYGLLREALGRALAAGIVPTDESAALERMGLSPKMIQGRADNLKLTRPEDVVVIAAILEAQADAAATGAPREQAL